jgi:hypothetical protein
MGMHVLTNVFKCQTPSLEILCLGFLFHVLSKLDIWVRMRANFKKIQTTLIWLCFGDGILVHFVFLFGLVFIIV